MTETATGEPTELTEHLPWHSRSKAAGAPVRVWVLTSVLWIVGLPALFWLTAGDPATGLDRRIGWGWLALGFYLAELLVVHLQFRRDAHTLSMSEVPMVLGLLIATPGALVVGQLVGSAVALAVHRRQRPVKLVFNLGQLVLQTAAAVWIFQSITGGVAGFDLRTILASLTAMVAALFLGHGAILVAIRVSGGSESIRETLRVLAVSSVGTVAATLLGVVTALSVVKAPEVWWIGVTPVLWVFVAYRAYVAQSEDKERMEALFDAATTLHRTPQIDRAVEASARRVLDLIKAERACVILFGGVGQPVAALTVVDADGRSETMIPEQLEGGTDLGAMMATDRRILTHIEAQQLGSLIGEVQVRQAMVDVLSVSGEPVGLLVGINRLGDVSAFTDADLRVLATLGSQLSTTLENSRLADNLAESRLLKEQLEALIESKNRLVASVSHELRTPLTGVVGLAAVMREQVEDRLDGETLGMLDLILEQGNELSNIIEDLLAHARAEAGTLSFRPEAFEVTAEMATVVASHQLGTAHSSGRVWGFADPLRVRQIVRNLITNARRYGGPTIELIVTGEARSVSISVVDDGPGIPRSGEASVFEPYQTAHDQRGQPGSVGLGLAVSRSLAHLMGGELTYARRHERTWFTLTIPAGLPGLPDS